MEKIIKIDIQNEEDLIEKYDNDVANHNLIEYILKKAMDTKKDEPIKIVIKNKCNTDIFIREKIIDGLKLEYDHQIKEHQRNNLIQIMLLLLGITFLFLSTLVSEDVIWKEVILIGGWVPIWEMVDIELFNEFRGRRIKKIIKKLIQSEFEIEN